MPTIWDKFFWKIYKFHSFSGMKVSTACRLSLAAIQCELLRKNCRAIFSSPFLSMCACFHTKTRIKFNNYESMKILSVLWLFGKTNKCDCHVWMDENIFSDRFSCRITNLHDVWMQTNKNVANNIQTFQTDSILRWRCTLPLFHVDWEEHEFKKCWNKTELIFISKLKLCRWHKWAFKCSTKMFPRVTNWCYWRVCSSFTWLKWQNG